MLTEKDLHVCTKIVAYMTKVSKGCDIKDHVTQSRILLEIQLLKEETARGIFTVL